MIMIMKILVISEFYNKVKGGGELSCKALVEKMESLGHVVKVWSADDDNIFYRLFKLRKDIKGYLKKYGDKYDVVHFYGVTPKVKTSIPNVTTVNSSLLWHPTGHLKTNKIVWLVGLFRMFSLRDGFNKDDEIIAVSEDVKKNLEYYCDFNNVQVVPSIV